MTGDAQRESLTEGDKLMLSIFLFLHLNASFDEIADFIHANGGDLYTQPQIT